MGKVNMIELLGAGMKAEGVRQRAIANNIANIRTPGYRRYAVKFEELLSEALDSDGKVDVGKLQAVVYQPKTTRVKKDGNDVNLETEIGEMVRNTLRHTTFARLLKKKLQGIQAAIQTK